MSTSPCRAHGFGGGRRPAAARRAARSDGCQRLTPTCSEGAAAEREGFEPSVRLPVHLIGVAPTVQCSACFAVLRASCLPQTSCSPRKRGCARRGGRPSHFTVPSARAPPPR